MENCTNILYKSISRWYTSIRNVKKGNNNMTKLNDIKALENKFIQSMGSGISSADSLYYLIDSANTSQTGQSLASAMFRLKAKGDDQGYRAVSAIVGTIFKGAKLKKAKDKKTLVLDISKAEFDSEKMGRFADALNKKLSIRSTLVKYIKGNVEKKDVELPKSAKAFVERMNKEGFSKVAIIAAIQAL
jgi:hypothetical protein